MSFPIILTFSASLNRHIQPTVLLPTDAAPPRCFICFRPATLCYCSAIPKIANRTDVVILQHRRERSHPFNTARIVNQSLQNCRLLAEHNDILEKRFDEIPLANQVGLLYPGNDSPLLSDLQPTERPEQLIILDGTWHHTKTLLRAIPRLRTLPCYRLAPRSPGRYRIRREPNEHSLSTLEATVTALRSLEPETAGFDQLLAVFERMVDDQLANPTSNWRHNSRRQGGAVNVPRALLRDMSKIVVAYGEQERGRKLTRKARSFVRPAPIYWTAQRLVDGDTFRCAITTDSSNDQDFLGRLQLTDEDFRDAVSLDLFRKQWQAFLRPDDQLVVYHSSTAKLLENVDAKFATTFVLKSINLDGQLQHGSLDDFLAKYGIEVPSTDGPRAVQRLLKAVALVRHLNTAYPMTGSLT